MGRVYLARSEDGRTVAVKVVHAQFAGVDEFRIRFAREVAALERVGSAGTAPVIAADTEAALPWVAIAYVPGPSLRTVVGDRRTRRAQRTWAEGRWEAAERGRPEPATQVRPLPVASVRFLAAGLGRALTHIHAAGLVHRDLKPSNILLTVDGPRIIDFGIARAVETVTDGGLTSTGAVIGSPGFMSPEQVRGERVTAASDIFCVGAVLAYAATGVQPFGASDSGVHAIMFRIANNEPDLTALPAELGPLVRSCLHRDPHRRPTAAALAKSAPARSARRPQAWLPPELLALLGTQAARPLDTDTPAPDHSGLDHSGSEPPGSEPPGSEPPGSEPPGSEPPGSEPPGPEFARPDHLARESTTPGPSVPKPTAPDHAASETPVPRHRSPEDPAPRAHPGHTAPGGPTPPARTPPSATRETCSAPPRESPSPSSPPTSQPASPTTPSAPSRRATRAHVGSRVLRRTALLAACAVSGLLGAGLALQHYTTGGLGGFGRLVGLGGFGNPAQSTDMGTSDDTGDDTGTSDGSYGSRPWGRNGPGDVPDIYLGAWEGVLKGADNAPHETGRIEIRQGTRGRKTATYVQVFGERLCMGRSVLVDADEDHIVFGESDVRISIPAGRCTPAAHQTLAVRSPDVMEWSSGAVHSVFRRAASGSRAVPAAFLGYWKRAPMPEPGPRERHLQQYDLTVTQGPVGAPLVRYVSRTPERDPDHGLPTADPVACASTAVVGGTGELLVVGPDMLSAADRSDPDCFSNGSQYLRIDTSEGKERLLVNGMGADGEPTAYYRAF
ncbi:protein kinase [Streptomyces sp. NPDC008125]|uniref:serine/threonine-protein kinase n=1 Tax=Streptomyces sp. NPDC008125 TaxID=3364811 RepID=UPI0036E00EAD